MKVKRCKIILKNLQIKSLNKAKKLAEALKIIEEQCGIHEVEISIEGFFICSWINLKKLNQSGMEKLLSRLFRKATKRGDVKRNSKKYLPSDKEVSKWYDSNIGKNCSSSSAIYKFRLWINELAK